MEPCSILLIKISELVLIVSDFMVIFSSAIWHIDIEMEMGIITFADDIYIYILQDVSIPIC